jgi:NAD(P)-dependent dehydrogenase (short-subunit alcohol dehydrogenase family)
MAAFAGIANRHVLVTGASQGIGRAIAVAFAEAGARVSAVARRTEQLATLTSELGGTGTGHGYAAVDLTVPGAAASVVASIVERAGPVEVVVHAAGGSLQMRDLTAPVEDWHKVWQLNVGQAIALNNAVLPVMAERGWGRIVHFSSRAGVDLSGAGAYSAAKAYLNAYVTIMGRAYAAKGVLINGVMPSAIIAAGNAWSKAVVDKPDEVRAFLTEHQTINRLGTPQDLIPFILLLASDDNQFVAGSILSLDGGSK